MAPLSHFENWEFRGSLGKGGFGEVHRWYNRITRLEIATKRLHNTALDSTSPDEQCKLFERWNKEYEWTRQLANSPHIVRGVRLDDEANAAFIKYLNDQHCCKYPVIVLEYCNGGDVRQLLQRPENSNGLVEFEVREILGALRSAIYFLHTHCKISHRDLKPDNIVIQRIPGGGKIYKLTDFGLARRSVEQTVKQSVVGTLNYFAPEIVDTGKYNHKIDYWSMGIIAYELCCGVLPFIPHQKLFNIIINIRKKPRECIAISEDPETDERFIFYNELPQEQRLSNVWSTKLIPWLRIALDNDYKSRGRAAVTNGGAADEVQTPFFFTELDKLLECKVLTAFAVCTYKPLAYEVTADMTMTDFLHMVVRDSGIQTPYIVLPTGHPHKRITQKTRPIDLFVADWQDTSMEAKNPPVMLYIFNAVPKCEFTAPAPSLPTVLQSCLAQCPKTIKPWLNQRLLLEIHFLLSDQQHNLAMFLMGLKEYAMTLEDYMLDYEPCVKEMAEQKLKMCGVMDHCKLVLSSGQKYTEQLFNNVDKLATWDSNWKKLCKKYDDTIRSVEGVLSHFESALRSAREEAINPIYDELTKRDIFEVSQFRDKYLLGNQIWLDMDKIATEILPNFANERARHLHGENGMTKTSQIIKLHDKINQSYNRFMMLPQVVGHASKAMTEIKEDLLQLELELFKNAATVANERDAQLNTSMQLLSLKAAANNPNNYEDSQQTTNLITTAYKTMQLLENNMETD